MKGIRVSTTGKDKLAIYIMHTHYQSQYPYTAIPPVEPPVPPVEYPFTQYVPNIANNYSWTIKDNEIQLPQVDQAYKWSIEDSNIPVINFNVYAVDNTYMWEVVDIGDIPETPPGLCIGLGDSYDIE